jgi:hypothetical protein
MGEVLREAFGSFWVRFEREREERGGEPLRAVLRGEFEESVLTGKKSGARSAAQRKKRVPHPLVPSRRPFFLLITWLRMSSSAPAISGKGCEDTTVAGNVSALKFFNGFMGYLASFPPSVAPPAVDDQDSMTDIQEIAESGGGAGSSSSSSSGSGSGAGVGTISLKELVTDNLPQLTTRLFWGQFAHYATFKAEKKGGNAYAHGTAKGYLNSSIRLVRECEDPQLGVEAKTFFEDAMKPKSWFKNIQAKMLRHFSKRAAQEGETLVKKAPAVALQQVIAASSVSVPFFLLHYLSHLSPLPFHPPHPHSTQTPTHRPTYGRTPQMPGSALSAWWRTFKPQGAPMSSAVWTGVRCSGITPTPSPSSAGGRTSPVLSSPWFGCHQMAFLRWTFTSF